MGKLLRNIGAPLDKFAGGDFFVAIRDLVAAFEEGTNLFSIAVEASLDLGAGDLAGGHAPALGEAFRHGLARRMEEPDAIVILDCLVHPGDGFAHGGTRRGGPNSLGINCPPLPPAAYQQADGRRD